LYLRSDRCDISAFQATVSLHHEYGVRTELIGLAEAHRRAPLIVTDGLVAALWSPDDARVTLDSVVLGYAGAARRLGAVLRTGVRVTRMETQAGEIVGARTDAGRIPTGTVVSSGRWLGCTRRSCPSAVAWRRTLARFERHLAA
jgi:sarcosine oxidase subunit beta